MTGNSPDSKHNTMSNVSPPGHINDDLNLPKASIKTSGLSPQTIEKNHPGSGGNKGILNINVRPTMIDKTTHNDGSRSVGQKVMSIKGNKK